MPDSAVHIAFGYDVLGSVGETVRAAIVDAPFRMALLGPDPWFVYLPGRKRENRGRRMHTEKTGDFLISLAKHCRDGAGQATLFSYLCGFICHYALDSAAHPYIIRMTSCEGARPGSHRALEHALDIAQLKEIGLWGSRHPLTGSLMPSLRLPADMRGGLDAAYREIYGWENCWSAMRKLYPFFRFLYRRMDARHGIIRFLAGITGNDNLKSLSYEMTWFSPDEAANASHAAWCSAYDSSLISTDSFADLRSAALKRASCMISEAWSFCFTSAADPDALAASFGNMSYYSGLPCDDVRNLNVPSLSPYPGVVNTSTCQ